MHFSYFSRRQSPRSVSSALKLATVVTLVVGLLLAALACGDKPGLVGKWEFAGMIWEFTADGKVLGIPDVPQGIEVTYLAQGDELTISAMGQDVMTAKFAVEGDTLKLINPEDPSEVETAQRVK